MLQNTFGQYNTIFWDFLDDDKTPSQGLIVDIARDGNFPKFRYVTLFHGFLFFFQILKVNQTSCRDSKSVCKGDELSLKIYTLFCGSKKLTPSFSTDNATRLVFIFSQKFSFLKSNIPSFACFSEEIFFSISREYFSVSNIGE